MAGDPSHSNHMTPAHDVEQDVGAIEVDGEFAVPRRGAEDGGGGADAHARLAAYVRWSITHDHDPADLVMLADPRLRQRMAERWAERLAVWVAVPADLPPGRRARWR